MPRWRHSSKASSGYGEMVSAGPIPLLFHTAADRETKE